jgi:glutathione peroxidase
MPKRVVLRLFSSLLLALSFHAFAASPPSSPADTTLTAWDFSLVMPDGHVQPLSAYRGKVLLIVNLASQSVYSSQLPALSQLQKTYAAKGLVILGVPSTDFGHEELSDPAAVAAWYAKQNLGFSVTAPATLTGVHAIPLVDFLTRSPKAPSGGPIRWNFTKFILDRSGHPVLRFEAPDDPASPNFAVQLETILDQPQPNPETAAPSKPASRHHGHITASATKSPA